MKILHLFKDYAPAIGGIETHLRTLAEAQARQGHQVTVLICGKDREFKEEVIRGVRVIRVGRDITIFSNPISMRYLPTLRKLRAEIVHVHIPFPTAEFAQVLSRHTSPYVVTYHADVTRPLHRVTMRAYRPLYRKFLAGAQKIIFTNSGAAQQKTEITQDRKAIVPLGIDLKEFWPQPNPPTRRYVRFLFVGRLVHYKGLPDLLNAMSLLPPSVQLWVAGDGPKKNSIQKLAKKLKLANRVKFLGIVPQTQLPDLYQKCDVFVLPSISTAEGFGTVLLEAMASGLPCITTQLGTGTTDAVLHEYNGLVVNPRNPEALAHAMKTLANSAELRKQMGLKSRKRAEDFFCEQRMDQMIHNIYQECLRN